MPFSISLYLSSISNFLSSIIYHLSLTFYSLSLTVFPLFLTVFPLSLTVFPLSLFIYHLSLLLSSVYIFISPFSNFLSSRYLLLSFLYICFLCRSIIITLWLSITSHFVFPIFSTCFHPIVCCVSFNSFHVQAFICCLVCWQLDFIFCFSLRLYFIGTFQFGF